VQQQIVFVARNVDAVTVEYFYVKAVGCPSRSVVKCVASCTGLYQSSPCGLPVLIIIIIIIIIIAMTMFMVLSS